MNIVKLVISGILFLGAFALFALATSVANGWEALTFFAGIVSISLSFALPMHAFNRD